MFLWSFRKQLSPLPPYSPFNLLHVFWLSAWWALRLPWWPPAECSNVSMSCEYWYLQNVFLFLYHCCILSEIKLTTTIVPNIVVGFKAAIYNVYKNIKRHTLHTIVSWPNPKQWIIVYNRCKNIRSTAFSAAVIIANHPLEFYEYCCYVKIMLSRYSDVVWSWYVSISARYSSHYICYG